MRFQITTQTMSVGSWPILVLRTENIKSLLITLESDCQHRMRLSCFFCFCFCFRCKPWWRMPLAQWLWYSFSSSLFSLFYNGIRNFDKFHRMCGSVHDHTFCSVPILWWKFVSKRIYNAATLLSLMISFHICTIEYSRKIVVNSLLVLLFLPTSQSTHVAINVFIQWK